MAAKNQEDSHKPMVKAGKTVLTAVSNKIQQLGDKITFWRTSPVPGAFAAEYEKWRDRFMWQRLRLEMWITLISMFSFLLRDFYDRLFPLKEFAQLSPELKAIGSKLLVAMILSTLGCLVIHKTRFMRRHPGWLFLAASWSVTMVEQVGATINGFALPDILAWFVVFTLQATLIPVRWYLHLLSQLVVIVYYFGVNITLGLKFVPPDSHLPIYNVTLIMALFWFCLICNLSVFLYERLQRREFYARKELEQAYQKIGVAEAKYRSIFENAVEGIFQSTPDGRYITANPALARIFGYASADEVTAKLTNLEQQLYVDPQRRREFVRLIETQDRVSEFESQVYRQDGSIVWISEKAYAVRDANSKVLYYEGLIEDITQRKQAEEALQEQFNFLQVLIDTIPTPVFYKNTEALYVGCNKAFEEAVGLHREQVIGKSVYDIAPKDLADQYHQADLELLRCGGVQTYESSLAYADGSQHDAIFYKAVFCKTDGSLGGLVGVILDISDRKRTEEALRTFFHAVSHDLRNPAIGSLMVLRNLLSSPGEKIPMTRGILERMVQSCDRQLNLINSLMEAHVSEVQGVILQTESIHLHTILDAAIADLEAQLVQNQATLSNLVTLDLPLVKADPTQLWRVFSNLIANGLKHNPPGLHLTINATQQGNSITCTVSDNGVGMTSEQCDRLFDLYFRGQNSRFSVSLGLGLYLCRQIITAHGGEIGVNSSPGCGSTFWFTLPICE